MKKLSYVVMMAAAGLMFQACHSNSGTDSTTAADSVNKVKDTTTNGSTGIAVVADDAKFAVDAANGGMTEIELSKLAATKAKSADVKKFADMMVMDHTNAGEQLKAVAKTKNITLPDSVSADSKQAIADLSKKAGAEFDKAYVDKMVADHKATVDMFESASKNLKDPDLKAFVDKTLPTIKGHLDNINKIKASMK
jgi:putative membrane protein